MLSYKLALRLKESGYPQTLDKGDWYYFVGRAGNWLVDTKLRSDLYEPHKYVKIPTLEDLLREIGQEKEFIVLKNYSKLEKAFVTAVGEGNVITENDSREGDSPEEALANLYLALHPKTI